MTRPECAHFLVEIEQEEQVLQGLQELLGEASGTLGKQKIAGEIKKKQRHIEDLEDEFASCQGLPPLPDPLTSPFPSSVSINSDNPTFAAFAPAPAANATLTFSQRGYSSVQLAFPEIVVGTLEERILFLVVSNTIRSRLVSGGYGPFELSTGHIDMTAVFSVSNSVATFGDSELHLVPLTTRSVATSLSPVGSLFGSPLSRNTNPGALVLVGSSLLTGGYYRGTRIDVTISGLLAQLPPA